MADTNSQNMVTYSGRGERYNGVMGDDGGFFTVVLVNSGSDRSKKSEVEMPRRSIMVFADAIEEKLRQNDQHKKPWETLDIDFLWYRAIDEMTELRTAIRDYKKNPDEWTARAARLEAVDSAALCMMVFSLLHSELNGLVRGREPEPSYFQHGGDAMPSDRAIMKGGL